MFSLKTYSSKIIFSGYYGQQNTGDDLFGIIATWGAMKYWNNKNSYLLSNKGPQSQSLEINYALSPKQIFKGQYLLQSHFEILRSDYCILAGGSILTSIPKIGTPRRLMFGLSTIKLIKLGAIGISLGPFSDEKQGKQLSKALKHFSFLALRDKSSFELASSMNLPFNPVRAADLAFLLPKMLGEINHTHEQKKRILGITVCHFERYINGNLEIEKKREKRISETIQLLSIHKDIRFRFFIFNNHPIVGDYGITKKLVISLKQIGNTCELVEYNRDSIDTYRKIAECSIVFSTRLHGAILAAAANVPSLLVEYHKKCSDYIDDIGIDNKWRIGDMDISPKEIAELILSLFKNNGDFNYTKRQNLIALAEKNFSSVSVQ